MSPHVAPPPGSTRPTPCRWKRQLSATCREVATNWTTPSTSSRSRSLAAGVWTPGIHRRLHRLPAGGAEQVVALDVGHGQLASELASDPRVVALDPNLRHVDPVLGGPFDLIVADLSFISICVVAPVLASLSGATQARAAGQASVRVGRGALGKAGVCVVASFGRAVRKVVDCLDAAGLARWRSPARRCGASEQGVLPHGPSGRLRYRG